MKREIPPSRRSGKAFPFRGRWHGEAVTDEVLSSRPQAKRLPLGGGLEAFFFPVPPAASDLQIFNTITPKKGAFPLDTGEKLAYNDNSQSADREQYRTAGFRERMAGASPPKLGWEGALERGQEMVRRPPPLPGQSVPNGEIQVEPRTAFVRPEPRRLRAFFAP